MQIELKSFFLGMVVMFILASAGTITGIAVYQTNQIPFKAVSIELAKIITVDSRAQCEKIHARNYKLEADGLQIRAGCTR